MHEVGADPLGRRAQRQSRLLQELGLGPATDVLEIGCGVGRLAHRLADVLEDGTYAGVDISPSVIAWLNEHYAPVLPGFRFDLLDVTNPRYRPTEGAPAADVRFPYDDDGFDLICAFEVCMHLQPAEIERYLTETRRVLRASGTAVVTALVITDDDDAPTNSGKPFVPLGDGRWTNKPGRDGFGMAYDLSTFEAMVDRAGLLVRAWHPGFWHEWQPDAAWPQWGSDVFILQPG